jgi:hypothetical protein
MAGIALIVGCAFGWLVAWLVWRRKAAELNQHICTLRTLLRGQEARLLDARLCLQEREATAERLRDRVSQGEQMIRGLTARVEEQRQALNWLNLAVRERDGYIKALRAQAGDTEPWTGELATVVQGEGWRSTATQCLELVVRQRLDHDPDPEASILKSEQRLLDLNARLVKLGWGLEASSRRLYGGAGGGDGAIRELEAWIKCRSGVGSSMEHP